MKILNYICECNLTPTTTILSEQDTTFWDLSSTLYSGQVWLNSSLQLLQTNKPVSTVIALVLVTLNYQVTEPVI